jgi:hypothetical protein
MNMAFRMMGVAGVCALLAGCETVANVAQNVADKARPTSTDKPTAAPPAAAAPAPAAAAPAAKSNEAACERNFTATGSFFAGKQFKTNAPLPNVSADAAYTKALAEVAKRGWQVISTDRAARIISANQNVSMSSAGKTVPFNVVIGEERGKGANIAFTFSIAGGLSTSEDAVKSAFCDFTKSLGG